MKTEAEIREFLAQMKKQEKNTLTDDEDYLGVFYTVTALEWVLDIDSAE